VTGLFAYLQYLLPLHWLTALGYRLARIRWRPFKDLAIRAFVRGFGVDVTELARPAPEDFESLNDFFTRELADGARPVAPGTGAVVSPVDGTVSQAGRLRDATLMQAKGLDYSLDDLLAADVDEARRYAGGSYATIYLAPHDYHRVHAPLAGTLARLHHVPGDLFSVNDATAARIPGLFRRNERLVMHFDAVDGDFVVILVGALNVGSISTPWTGEIRPAKHGVVQVLEPAGADRTVARGDLLGWFNMGSTVIVLLPPGAATLDAELAAGRRLRMGERIGTFDA